MAESSEPTKYGWGMFAVVGVGIAALLGVQFAAPKPSAPAGATDTGRPSALTGSDPVTVVPGDPHPYLRPFRDFLPPEAADPQRDGEGALLQAIANVRETKAVVALLPD